MLSMSRAVVSDRFVGLCIGISTSGSGELRYSSSYLFSVGDPALEDPLSTFPLGSFER